MRPRSGLALRHGLGMVNSPGTIDSDYRGVVQVLLINLGQEPVTVQPWRPDRAASRRAGGTGGMGADGRLDETRARRRRFRQHRHGSVSDGSEIRR